MHRYTLKEISTIVDRDKDFNTVATTTSNKLNKKALKDNIVYTKNSASKFYIGSRDIK